MATTLQPDESSARLTELNRLGAQLFQEKLYPQALEVLQQVVELTEAQQGPLAPALGLALLNRGRMLRLLERNAECEADYHRALEILRLHPAIHQNEIIWPLKNLIALYRNTGRRSEAEPGLRELLAVQRTALRPDDPLLADLLVELGGACYERGALPDALAFTREALSIRESSLGPNHPSTIELREGLSALQARPGPPAPAPGSTGPATDPADRFNACMRTFLRQDYRGASQRALALISSGTMTHGLLQVLLISLQRSGQGEALAQVAAQVPRITEAGVPWERSLLELTLGTADPNAVLAGAQDDAQRGQVFYYTAERLITAVSRRRPRI